jgi:hypothetical protein
MTKISGEIGQRTWKKRKSGSSKLGQEREKLQQDKEKSRGSTDNENFGRNWTKDLQKAKCKPSKLGQEWKIAIG